MLSRKPTQNSALRAQKGNGEGKPRFLSSEFFFLSWKSFFLTSAFCTLIWKLFLASALCFLGWGRSWAADRYWVLPAGTSNYATNNWSAASGGAADGLGTPGPNDRALFDGGGLGGCTIDVSTTVALLGGGSQTFTPPSAAFNNLTLSDGLVGYWKLDETASPAAGDDVVFDNTSVANCKEFFSGRASYAGENPLNDPGTFSGDRGGMQWRPSKRLKARRQSFPSQITSLSGMHPKAQRCQNQETDAGGYAQRDREFFKEMAGQAYSKDGLGYIAQKPAEILLTLWPKPFHPPRVYQVSGKATSGRNSLLAGGRPPVVSEVEPDGEQGRTAQKGNGEGKPRLLSSELCHLSSEFRPAHRLRPHPCRTQRKGQSRMVLAGRDLRRIIGVCCAAGSLLWVHSWVADRHGVAGSTAATGTVESNVQKMSGFRRTV